MKTKHWIATGSREHSFEVYIYSAKPRLDEWNDFGKFFCLNPFRRGSGHCVERYVIAYLGMHKSKLPKHGTKQIIEVTVII